MGTWWLSLAVAVAVAAAQTSSPTTPAPPPPPFDASSSELSPRTGRPINEVVIGALGIRGEADLYARWNATYQECVLQTVVSTVLGGRTDPFFTLVIPRPILDEGGGWASGRGR
jgi:hypothetical protein